MPKPGKVSFTDCWDHFMEPAKPTGMSPQYDRMRSCVSKNVFPTRELADKMVVQVNRTNADTFMSYRCRWCNMYHIGHVPGTKKVTNATTQ